MDKIALLESRRAQAQAQNQSALDFVDGIVDEASFVETDTYYFAGNDLVDNGTIFGEGVVCGSGTIGGIPVCLFAQNFDVMKGGLSKGQADKIVKCMDRADEAGLPIVCILNSAGARLGEGIRVLDGYARVIKRFSDLWGQVPTITVVRGEVYGPLAAFAKMSDFTFVMKDAVLSTNSPAVITAKSGKEKSNDFFAAKNLAARGIADRVCKDGASLKSDLETLLDLLAGGEPVLGEDDLNATSAALNKGYKAENIVSKVFDKKSFFELRAESGSEVRTGFAKIGGKTVGVAVCSDEGKELSAAACNKISSLNDYLDNNDLPLVLFVNAKGFVKSLDEEEALLREQTRLFESILTGDALKISVVCGEACGSVYSALVSKEIGIDYNFAWATSVVSLLSGEQGAELTYADEIGKAKNREKARAAAAEKYAEVEGDVFNAVKCGSIDEVIEPALTRQYLLSVLMSHED